MHVLISGVVKYAIIYKMQEPITQSKEWQNLQNELGEESVYKDGNGYHFLAIIKSTPVGNYLYLPYGPVAENEESFKESLEDVKSLAYRNNAIFIRIEPNAPEYVSYLPQNTKKSKDLNPKDTWVLNLTQDKETIISNFSQGTRTRYNTFQKKGLIVESTRDIEEIKHLVALQDKLFKTKNLHSFGEDYLKKELKQPFATLYLVRYRSENQENPKPPIPNDNQVIAASLFFDYKDTRYYMQSAADSDYKRLPATVALLTTAIFDAKEKGIKYFDFWGIAPDDAPDDHPWKGFTEFKKSFGGEAHHYAGTYDIILKPSKYKLYQKTRKLNRFIRRSRA